MKQTWVIVSVGFSLALGCTTSDVGAGVVKQIIDVIGTNSDVTGWNLQDAVAVSDDGKVIAGTGTNASGVAQGWVLHLP